MSTGETIEVRIKSVAWEALGIHSLELRPLHQPALPPFTAGAHVDLLLPNGMTRSYSLVNRQSERHRYVIAVNRDAASRGGSRFVHESLRAGDTLRISPPRNNFPLEEGAAHSVLIAGGIGITPLWCMVQRLHELGRDWQLYYCARTPQHAAFLERVEALDAPAQARVHLNFDGEPGGRMLDLRGVVEAAATDAHLYCCGPNSMLASFEEVTQGRTPGTVHVEYFTARSGPAASGGFTVVLARSGRSVSVPPGKTILDALLDAGIDVPYSCTEGVCGTCEMGVLEGVPDHRDLVLSKEERAAGRTMMICCSGCKSDKLVLDW
jgi:ferredoxin-NADP reductase